MISAAMAPVASSGYGGISSSLPPSNLSTRLAYGAPPAATHLHSPPPSSPIALFLSSTRPSSPIAPCPTFPSRFRPWLPPQPVMPFYYLNPIRIAHSSWIASGIQVLERKQSLKDGALVCRSGLIEEIETESIDTEASGGQGDRPRASGGGGDGGGGGAMGWVSSALVFALWGAFISYSFIYSPNQTPYRDRYFLEILVGLRTDDAFQMNQVLVSLWYIMGLWPLMYSMLLIPSGRSSNNGVPVWPFATLSCFFGAFALLPYFGLWKPPPPPVSKTEFDRWPLKVFESNLFSVVIAIAGVVLVGSAVLAGGEQWKEFLQYFRESRFIHITSLDFLALSSLAPFWVYNDLATRERSNKNSWLILLALVPYLGPALYLILRPPLPANIAEEESGK